MEQSVLELIDASIGYREKKVFQNISMQIAKGEFVYLIGKTGSGKSSLFKTLYADIPLLEGKGTLLSYSLNQLKNKEIPQLRKQIGIIFQDFKLLNDRDVYENLAFVLKATGWKDTTKIKKRINELLIKVGIQEKQKQFPYQLSGGEQQRVAIARALLNNPDFIIADEPTGNLDPETSIKIMELLWEINKEGKSVFMATHNYTLLTKFPSKKLRCQNGQIFEVIQKT